ncbi:MAG: DUF1566 domain-containing protein [Campylobacterota bacterium]
MKIVFLLFVFISFSFASFFNLNISENELLDRSGKKNMKVAYLMAKISEISYKDSLSNEDIAFLEDNGFSNIKLNSSYGGNEFISMTKDEFAKKIVVIGFRGTSSFKDLLTDLNSKKANFVEDEEIIVHSGFQNYMTKIRDNEPSILIDNNNLDSYINSNTIFILTGHSLGGAVAKLYGASLKQRGILGDNIYVHTFGAPPVSFNSSQKSFKQTFGYNKIFISQYENRFDPIYNLSSIYFKDGSMLEQTESILRTFDENSQLIPRESCKYVGSQAILNLEVLNIFQSLSDAFTNELAYNKVNSDLKNCDMSFKTHFLGSYLNNIIKNIDFYELSKNSIDSFNGNIYLSEDKALSIASLIYANEKYKNAITLNKFDSFNLSKENRKKLIFEIKALGLDISASSFGHEGEYIKNSMKNMVQAKQLKIDELKNNIDSSMSLEFNDYTKFAWGSALNTTSAVADILTLGSSSFITKLPKVSTKLNTLTSLTYKTKGAMKKAFEFTQSKHFIWVKSLIEQGFNLNDSLIYDMKNQEDTASFASTIIGSYGDISNEALQTLVNNNKHKFAVYFVSKLNDLVIKIVQGSTENIIKDDDLKIAIDGFIDAVYELTPIAGPFYSQYKLAKKISDDIDNKPEVINAWAKYFDENERLLTSIKLLGDLWFNKRVDLIINKALIQSKIIERKKLIELEQIEQNKPSVIFNIQDDITLEDYKIQGNINSKVSITVGKNALSLKEFIQDALDSNSTIKLWYKEVGSNKIESLNVNIENHNLNILLPSDSGITPLRLSYTSNKYVNRTYSHSLPMKWEVNRIPTTDTNSTKNISLIDETITDYTVMTSSFTKSWTFNQNIEDFDVKIVNNNYLNDSLFDGGITFIKSGNQLMVDLRPDNSKSENRLEVKLIDKNSEAVKVNGSETIWSITKTNSKPVLSKGQLTQTVTGVNETASLKIDTYDSDGDFVNLSIENSDGGDAYFDKSVLKVSFNDNNPIHTVKIGLNDGKEKVVKDITIFQLDPHNITSFYSDVDINNSNHNIKDIAFITLMGVASGQQNPNDNTKRVFRPDDNASLAETLAMIINAANNADKINLNDENVYISTYPTWASSYYTYAYKRNALEKTYDLSINYPTLEEVAKILVKVLKLDKNIELFDNLNYNFSLENKFSNALIKKYAKITRAYGLLFLSDYSDPTMKISRADLAKVVSRIFMIPKLKIRNLGNISYHSSKNLLLYDIEAKYIDENYYLQNNEDVDIKAVLNGKNLNPLQIIGSELNLDKNELLMVVDNKGVRNIIYEEIKPEKSDIDKDLVIDALDKWKYDGRYAYDENNNEIPDVLDNIYDLNNYTVNDSVLIENKYIKILDLIEKGTHLDINSSNELVNDNFEKKGDVVYDTITTLSWSDKSYTESSFTFDEANEYCENLVVNEFNDWRLPTSKELTTIIEFGLSENRTLNEIFENHPVYLWTSSENSKDTTRAIYYDMWNGQSYFGDKGTSSGGINLTKKVKCVRGQNITESVNFTKDTNQNIVIDNTKDLLWEDREFEGQTYTFAGDDTIHFSVDEKEYKTWGEARDYCQDLTHANQSNWRLPTIQELYSTLDNNTNNALNTFEHIYDGHYWSSTLDEDIAGAFRMDLENGSNGVIAITSDDKANGYGGGSRFVKCVADASDIQIDTIQLNKGWNLVSIPSDNIINIDNLTNDEISTVYSYQNNTWKVWTKEQIQTNYNQLLNLEDSYGYWIFATNETNIDIPVTSNPDTKQIVANTWSLQGSRQISDFDSFFNSTDTSIIWKYKDGKYKAIAKDSQINSKLISNDINPIESIEKYEGFWVR